MLSAYPDDVIMAVTDPYTGLPSTVSWMPSVAELKKSCEDLMRPRREQLAYEEGLAQQLRERREWEKKQ